MAETRPPAPARGRQSCACAVIMIDLLIVRPEYTWPGLIIVLTGIPVYFFWRLFGKKPAQ